MEPVSIAVAATSLLSSFFSGAAKKAAEGVGTAVSDQLRTQAGRLLAWLSRKATAKAAADQLQQDPLSPEAQRRFHDALATELADPAFAEGLKRILPETKRQTSGFHNTFGNVGKLNQIGTINGDPTFS